MAESNRRRRSVMSINRGQIWGLSIALATCAWAARAAAQDGAPEPRVVTMQSIAESLVDEPLETPADLDRIDLESAWDDAVRDESAEGVEELSDATPVSLPEGFQ